MTTKSNAKEDDPQSCDEEEKSTKAEKQKRKCMLTLIKNLKSFITKVKSTVFPISKTFGKFRSRVMNVKK